MGIWLDTNTFIAGSAAVTILLVKGGRGQGGPFGCQFHSFKGRMLSPMRDKLASVKPEGPVTV